MSACLLLDGIKLTYTQYGNEFVLLRQDSTGVSKLPALGKAILDHQFDFIEEVIATNIEICLKFNRRFNQDSLSLLEQIKPSSTLSTTSNESEILKAPICFSNQENDWTEVIRQTNRSRTEYIEQLLSCRFRVAMYGFLPGFLYLEGLPPDLHVLRKDSPDKRTPANAFAIGGKYVGIYSLPSPAGWNVIGSLGVQLLNTEQLPPLVLNPGDAISLVQVDESELQQLVQQRLSILEYNG